MLTRSIFSEDPANLEQIVLTNGMLCLASNHVAWIHVSTKYSSPTHEKASQILALNVTIPQITACPSLWNWTLVLLFKHSNPYPRMLQTLKKQFSTCGSQPLGVKQPFQRDRLRPLANTDLFIL